MTKGEIRTVIAALRPPAEAFARAQAKGYVVLDEDYGWMRTDTLPLPIESNPEQLRFEEA